MSADNEALSEAYRTLPHYWARGCDLPGGLEIYLNLYYRGQRGEGPVIEKKYPDGGLLAYFRKPGGAQ